MFQQALDFSDGEAVVQLNDTWGYVNKRRMFRKDPQVALVAQRVFHRQYR